jgi:hypothetical protein
MVGCGAATSDDAGPVQPLDVDVVVLPDRIAIYTNASDATADDCRSTPWGSFPAIGGTVQLGDVACRTTTCLTRLAIEGDDGFAVDALVVPADGVVNVEPYTARLPAPWPAHPRIVLSGCGVSNAAIPIDLDPAALPTPTLDVTRNSDTNVTLTWASTPPAPTAMFEVRAGLATTRVHVSTSPYVYASPSDNFTVTDLWATVLFAPTTMNDPIGVFRIWPAGSLYRAAGSSAL